MYKYIIMLSLLSISMPASAERSKRLLSLSKEIRCVVCQGQSIADSNAPIAKDMKHKIKLLLEQKKTEKEIRRYLSQRYGDNILLRPPVNRSTWLLWGFPLLAGLSFLGRYAWKLAGK